MNRCYTPLKATLDCRHWIPCLLRVLVLLFPLRYVFERARARRWFNMDSGVGGFASLPTVGLSDLIVISLAAVATMSTMSHQHIKPLGR